MFPHLSAARPDLLDQLLALKGLPEDSVFATTDYFELAPFVWEDGEHYRPDYDTGPATDCLWVILPLECWWVAGAASCHSSQAGQLH